MSLMENFIIVIHDISSAQRLIDFAKLVYGLGFRVLIASKVYGAAASSGIPEVMRLAVKKGRIFTVLGNVREVIDLFQPKHVVIVSRDYGEPIDPAEYAKKLLSTGERVALIFGGIDPAPSKDVASLGEAIYPVGSEARLGPVAEAALLLYPLRISSFSQGTS
jgi:SpoU rRNA methylase family enzyme